MNIKIGANIKKLRTENNITQDALATAIGVTPQAVSRCLPISKKNWSVSQK